MCFKGFFTHFFLRGYFFGENNTFSLDKDTRQLRRCWILDFYKFLDSSNRRCDWAPSLGIVGLEQFSAAQVLCMGVAVGNVGMNADELRSTFTAECYTAVHLVRSQNAGRTA